MVSPIGGYLFNAFRQGISGSSRGSQNVSEIMREFFRDLFYHPGRHKVAVIIFAVVVVALVVGGAFLAMKAYEKFREHP